MILQQKFAPICDETGEIDLVWVQLESRQIKAAAYDQKARLLALLFRDGDAVHLYADVKRQIFLGLLSARSPADFYCEHINERPFKKLRSGDKNAI